MKNNKKKSRNTQQPNILFILTDQHRLSAIAAYGHTVCKTPNMDRLARQGVLFQNAYTVCPVCSPARATIMTGLFPHSHGMCANVHDLGCSVHELADSDRLLSRQLRDANYSIGYSGKWHLGTDRKEVFSTTNVPSLPSTVGFEGQDFPGHGGGGFDYPQYKQYLKDNNFEHGFINSDHTTFTRESMGELSGPIESTVPYFITENTISMIDKFSKWQKPFFLWHNFWGPHEPYYATSEFLDLYRHIEIPQWQNYMWPSRKIPGPHHVKIGPDHEKLTWEHWAKAIRHYYAFTTMIDSQIGRMIDHLDKTALIENTIIIFSADHGQTLGSHGGLVDKGFHHFDEIQRIPLIIRFPDKFGSGTVKTDLVSLIDLYPTILDLAGVECDNKNLHGKSLLQTINGSADNRDDIAVVEFDGLSGSSITLRTIRYKEFKYGYSCGFEDEFYDLAKDPHEMKNLINDPRYCDIIQYMKERLAKWMTKTNDMAAMDPRIGPTT